MMDQIMNKYDKENEYEYRNNREGRIMEVLKLANVDPEDYLAALKESIMKGTNVILARDIDELNVNNYNPEWLEAWDGNIDIRQCTDFFAVVTYITEYFTKDESGTSSFLAEASKQIKALPIKNQKRCIQNMKLKDLNISSVFVPLGKKEEISRYLLRDDPELL